MSNNKDIEEYYRAPTAASKQAAVLSMTKFIHRVAVRFRHPASEDYKDLMQQGYIGVLNALETYDKDKGAFTTHSYFQIFDQMSRHLSMLTGQFNFLMKHKNHYYKILFHLKEFNFDNRNLRASDCRVISEKLNVPLKHVELFLMSYYNVELRDIDDLLPQGDVASITDMMDLDRELFKYPEEHLQQLALSAQGFTSREIAAKYNVSKTLIDNRVKRIKQGLKDG